MINVCGSGLFAVSSLLNASQATECLSFLFSASSPFRFHAVLYLSRYVYHKTAITAAERGRRNLSFAALMADTVSRTRFPVLPGFAFLSFRSRQLRGQVGRTRSYFATDDRPDSPRILEGIEATTFVWPVSPVSFVGTENRVKRFKWI